MARESLQKKVGRVRPPRVHITYDVEIGGAIEQRDLPFVVGVLANLSGMPPDPLPPISQRKFVLIDRDNINNVMKGIAPHVAFNVQNCLNEDDNKLSVKLNFENMDDFEPESVARRITPLRELLELRCNLANLRSSLMGNEMLESVLQELIQNQELLHQAGSEAGIGDHVERQPEPMTESQPTAQKMPGRGGILDGLAQKGRLGRNSEERDCGKLWIKSLIQEVVTGRMMVLNDTELMITNRIAKIDEAVSRQLDEVMHAEPLQRLEASWRGLSYFVVQTETSSSLKIKVLNVSKAELLKDLDRVAEFDQSALYNKIYDEEYGSMTGDPFGVLIGDYEFGRQPQDIGLLEKMSHIAANSHAPFISAASPALFNFESFTELSGPRDLERIFDEQVYQQWNMFRRSDDSRYVGLCLPRVLMRLPYGTNTTPVEGFDYEESFDDHSKYLWGNTAYAFAARLTDAFARHEWCAAIRGVEGGGLVEALPVHTFATDEGDLATRCPTEIAITDRRENELAMLGFIPLCHYKGTYAAVFMGTQSTQKPQLYLDDEANANARLSTQLQYTLACSRFAHFLKKIVRGKIGLFLSPGECETFLNNWMSRYVLLDDVASQELKAKFPMRDARVQVAEDPGKPGALNAIVFLRPHFQLDEMAVSLRMVVRLPQPNGIIGRPSSEAFVSG